MITRRALNTPEFKETTTKLGYVLELQDFAKLRTNMPRGTCQAEAVGRDACRGSGMTVTVAV